MSPTSYRRLICLETTSCVYRTGSFIPCVTSALISVDIIFYTILELHSTLSEKRLSSQISFQRIHPTPQTPTLNGQNLHSVTKVFFSVLPKMLFETFSKNFQKFVDKILQKHRLCISNELQLPLYF